MGEPIDDLLVNQITAGMLDADSEDDKKLWADMVPTYMKKVVWRGYHASSRCNTTPTPPPSFAVWSFGAAAQAAAPHPKPGAWLKPCPGTGNDNLFATVDGSLCFGPPCNARSGRPR